MLCKLVETIPDYVRHFNRSLCSRTLETAGVKIQEEQLLSVLLVNQPDDLVGSILCSKSFVGHADVLHGQPGLLHSVQSFFVRP